MSQINLLFQRFLPIGFTASHRPASASSAGVTSFYERACCPDGAINGRPRPLRPLPPRKPIASPRRRHLPLHRLPFPRRVGFCLFTISTVSDTSSLHLTLYLHGGDFVLCTAACSPYDSLSRRLPNTSLPSQLRRLPPLAGAPPPRFLRKSRRCPPLATLQRPHRRLVSRLRRKLR